MNRVDNLWMTRPKRITAVNEKTGEMVIFTGNRETPRGLKIKEEKMFQRNINKK